MSRLSVSVVFLSLASIAIPASAQDREVPYWATLRSAEVNMRVGPSEAFPIEWVYQREGLPVKVIRLREGWRLVEDPDGARGWIVARLLDPKRGAIVVGDGLAEIRASAESDARLLWKVEPGNVGSLSECASGWCRIDIAGHEGWIREERLWGDGEP